ncbi:MAG: AAA family ATPase, partial [Bacilli bacterium]|nr:AAA family ATPase [Bacilli bacterium]
MNIKYTWIEFYKEFADNLLKYKNNRKDLINIIKSVYEETKINLATLDKDGVIVDIDPFTVFGLFNKQITEDKRKLLASELGKRIGVITPAPTNLDGLPVLNNQNATFFPFIHERKEQDINNLWNLFESALVYAKDDSEVNKAEMSKWFDYCVNLKYNGNSKITMGLFWIAPDVFINLDSRNEWFIYKANTFPQEFVKSLPVIESKIAASKYFALLDAIKEYIKTDDRFENFVDVSNEAWKKSNEVNKLEKAKIKTADIENAMGDDSDVGIRYWIYSPGDGSAMWDEFYDKGIMALKYGEIEDATQYTSKQEIINKLKATVNPEWSFKWPSYAIWQFVHEMKVGDVVFVKKGLHKVIGRGVVTSDYQYDPEQEDGFKHIRAVDWTHNGEWPHPGNAIVKTLTDITPYPDYVDKLNAFFVEEESKVEEIEEKETKYAKYNEDDFLNEVYMDKDEYHGLVSLLKNKKNIILQGAQGVGKTYMARRLAWSIMGEKNTGRVMLVQFHQSYSYEDFIEGYRPNEKHFELSKGVFYNFCKEAKVDEENPYFFIIDEINRGN